MDHEKSRPDAPTKACVDAARGAAQVLSPTGINALKGRADALRTLIEFGDREIDSLIETLTHLHEQRRMRRQEFNTLRRDIDAVDA